jgi:hypothetical protein
LGYGTISGNGGGEVLSDPQLCADFCNDEPSCLTYEFDASTMKCSLNTVLKNSNTDYQALCEKGKSLLLGENHVLIKKSENKTL